MKGVINFVLLLGALLLLFSWSLILYPDFYSWLRDYGVPVPYCTSNDLAVACEFKSPATSAHVKSVLSSSPVYVLLSCSEDVELLNEICNASLSGTKVFARLSKASECDPLAESLVSCGVSVSRGYTIGTLVVSSSALYISNDFYSLYTDCESAVKSVYSSVKSRWSS